MPKPKPARARGLGADTKADYGARYRLAPHEYQVEDAADPETPNRTVRRVRKKWTPDVLLLNGSITQAHHDAAQRYHNAYAVGMMGARDKIGVYVDCRGAPHGISDARLAAATDYQRASQAVGITLQPALAWCVLSTGTIAGWAECKGWDKNRAWGYLMAALDRLAEHYRLT